MDECDVGEFLDIGVARQWLKLYPFQCPYRHYFEYHKRVEDGKSDELQTAMPQVRGDGFV